MGSLSTRTFRKRRFISDFLEELDEKQREEFHKKTSGWCLILEYTLINHIRENNCSISEAPNFCFKDGTTSREISYSRRYPKIIRCGDMY